MITTVPFCPCGDPDCPGCDFDGEHPESCTCDDCMDEVMESVRLQRMEDEDNG